MSRRHLFLLTAVAALPALLVAATGWLVGAGVAGELRRVEAEFAAHEAVSIDTLQYRRGLFDGTVAYALTVRTAALLPEQAPLLVLLTGDREGSLRLTGTARVRHGPWVGDGVALLAAETGLVLPAVVTRGLLPDLPAGTAVLRARARLDWSGRMQLWLSGADYHGRIGAGLLPLRGALEVFDWGGHLELDAEASALLGWLHASRVELALDWPQAAALSIHDLGVSLAAAASVSGAPGATNGHDGLRIEQRSGAGAGQCGRGACARCAARNAHCPPWSYR
jgi:hypothetical protein